MQALAFPSSSSADPMTQSIRSNSLKGIIRNFPPAWFAVNMGTGSISDLFYIFPYGNGTQIMRTLSLIFFFLNLSLFILLTTITIIRYILFPDMWNLMMHHPVESLYLGCYPMGATTLINIAVNLVFREYGFGGKGLLYAMWSMWWLDVATSLMCCWILVHVMITRQNHSLPNMTPVWLLPVVALIKASSSGGMLVCPLQEFSVTHALVTLAFSISILTIGLSLALMMLVVYLLRLIVHGLPPGATILSVFIPLSPTGQAGYSFLLIGQSFRSLLPMHSKNSELLTSDSAGEIIDVICICSAFMLWSFAVMWMLFALLAVQEVLRVTRFPFCVNHWGLIFPNGVLANLTIQLAQTLDSSFFRIFGALYATVTLILWTCVATRTAMLVWNASIFEAPCLEGIFVDKSPPPKESGRVQDVEVV